MRPCRDGPGGPSALVILQEIVPLACAELVVPSGAGPRVCLTARPRVLRLRRRLSSSLSGRIWVLEVEVEVPATDPEQLLAECEEFLVDGRDGREIGVVDRVETSPVTGAASTLLVSAGWFGRRRFRIDADAVEVVLPAEQRLIVDESRVVPARDDESLA